MDEIQALYERYRGDLYGYLLSLTRDAAVTEELLSETFCAAIIALPRFRGDADVKTWLFSIARRKWTDYLRKRHPTEPLELAALYIADPSPTPEEMALLKSAAERAMTLLKQEDKRAQTIFRARLEGYSYYEIANTLGIRESSARVIDFRTRKKLRTRLQEEGYHGIL